MTDTEQILAKVIEKQSEQIAELTAEVKELRAQLAYFQRRMLRTAAPLP